MSRHLLAGLLLFAGAVLADPPLRFLQARLYEAPPGVETLAAYFTIENPGSADRVLRRFRSDDFARVELHETRLEDGVAHMVPVPALTVPAGGRVALAPGGLHLMLIEPKRPLRAGDHFLLEIEEADGTLHQLLLPLRRREDAGGHEHHSHHD
ncbi:MAG: hypothetical protein KatS3mg121_0243 [Gammaproteobacteria bacterium]|nr:MAG: hypothetical protein KatS3mg121_0243 [Gammaproteobacteria bacterium]